MRFAAVRSRSRRPRGSCDPGPAPPSDSRSCSVSWRLVHTRSRHLTGGLALTCPATAARVDRRTGRTCRPRPGCRTQALPALGGGWPAHADAVVKVGGSVLRDVASFAAVARVHRLAPGSKATNGLSSSSRPSTGPPMPCSKRRRRSRVGRRPDALDLLWSTGELRSVARLSAASSTVGSER